MSSATSSASPGPPTPQRPTWLQRTYAALDCAVWDAYGWPADVEEDIVLSRLLALNANRAT